MRNALFLILILLLPVSSRGYVWDLDSQAQPRRWKVTTPHASIPATSFNRDNGAIRYYVGQAGYSVTNTAAEINAVHASFAQWSSVPGTGVKFEFGGLLPGNPVIDYSDGTNAVFWARNSTLVNNGEPSGGTLDISGSLGFAFPNVVDGTTELAECDIVLNGVDFVWYTDRLTDRTGSSEYLIEGTMVHEIGHLLGLSHTPIGSASMYWTGQRDNLTQQAGLSSDEISVMQGYYGDGTMANVLGSVSGTVTMSGSAVYGAAVILSDANGAVVAAAMTDGMGNYQIDAVPAGNGSVRAVPLDPPSGVVLINGPRISSDYQVANTAFSPSASVAVTVVAMQDAQANLTVTPGRTGFHITHVLPNGGGGPRTAATFVHPSESPILIGVALPFGMTSQTVLDVLGTGVSVGATDLNTTTFPGYSFLTAMLTLDPNAVPGMRTLRLTEGIDSVYANGFLEIIGDQEDFNFDGVDDAFQRTYFDLWTSAEAGPDADPDDDQFPNRSESIAGTHPKNAQSRLQVDEVIRTMTETTVRWQAVSGKRYQLSYKDTLEDPMWQNVGVEVTASSSVGEAIDATAAGQARFYRVMVVE